LEKEFDSMQKIEQDVLSLYNKHFITLSCKESCQSKDNLSLYPTAFEELFNKKELKELQKPLLWLEVHFPSVAPKDMLDNVFCSINSFPVLNRKLNRFTYKLIQSLNIVPLETEDTFLSLKEIINSEGNQVKLTPFGNEGKLEPETFTLRYRINRFDERDSYETLVNLTELIREESSFFSSLGEDFLIQNIRELNQILARIEDKIKVRKKNQSPYPYLIIKPEKEGNNVSIEFWSSNGSAANKIPLGSRLQSHCNSNIKTNTLFFITSTFGGRDQYTDGQLIEQYKKSLLTHNRIVTMEDLKIVINSELGSSAKSVEYKKTYLKSTRPGEGFIRCMEIIVTPEQNSMEEDEWDQRLRELQLKLQRQSSK